MKIIIISIISSCILSVGISHWYLEEMTKRTQQSINQFFEQYEHEYKNFLSELKNKHN